MKELIVIAAGFACLAAAGADAQTRNCAQRERVVTRLGETYGEGRQAIGLAASNQVVETWANLESGTWTVTVTTPNGLTCLVASGKSFELVDEEVAKASEKDA